MTRNFLTAIAFSALLASCATPERERSPVYDPAGSSGSRASAPTNAELVLQTLFALGVDYRNGGVSPVSGFDCSGLVAHVYREAYGMRLPRSTAEQSRLGRPIERSELAPGDLVFYDTLGYPFSHVGIYLGEGRFVHAPRTGARVRIESVENPYWRSRFSGARRLLKEHHEVNVSL